MYNFDSESPLSVDVVTEKLREHGAVTVGGTYLISQPGLRGGMGVVYKCWDSQLQRNVALKVLFEPDPSRIQREAIAAAIEHPHICPVYELKPSLNYFVMRWINGPALGSIALGQLRAKRVLEYGAAIAGALETIRNYRGGEILHNDIHPGNILVHIETNTPILVDFSLCARTGAMGERCGTEGYMPPEKCSSQRGPLTWRSEVWSLAAVVYRCLTGEPPFSPNDREFAADVQSVKFFERNRRIPEEIDEVLAKALAVTPEMRYETPGEFQAALAKIVEAMAEKPPVFLDSEILRLSVVPIRDERSRLKEAARELYDRYLPDGIACAPLTIRELIDNYANSLFRGERLGSLNLEGIQTELESLQAQKRSRTNWSELSPVEQDRYRSLASRGYNKALQTLTGELSAAKMDTRRASLQELLLAADERVPSLEHRSAGLIGEAGGFGSKMIVTMQSKIDRPGQLAAERAALQEALNRAGITQLHLLGENGNIIRQLADDAGVSPESGGAIGGTRTA